MSYFKLSFATNYLARVIVSHEKQTLSQTLGNINRGFSFFLVGTYWRTMGEGKEKKRKKKQTNKIKQYTITAIIIAVGSVERITVVQM